MTFEKGLSQTEVTQSNFSGSVADPESIVVLRTIGTRTIVPSGFPELSMVQEKPAGDKSDGSSDAAQPAGGGRGGGRPVSWSTQDVAQAIRYLDSVRNQNEALLRATPRNGGDRTQSDVYNMLKTKVLPELKKSGAISGEWDLYPSAPHSAADKVGADYLLVNKKTGAVHFLDGTRNPEKENIYELRKKGVFLVGEGVFDRFGDLEQVGDTGRLTGEAAGFYNRVSTAVKELAGSKPSFVIGKEGCPIPSLDVTPRPKTEAEIKQLADWAREQVRGAENATEAEAYRRMATTVEKSVFHSQVSAQEVHSPDLAKSLKSAAESEIAKYVLQEAKPQAQAKQNVVVGQNNGKPAGDKIKIAKDELRLRTESGERFTGGSVMSALANARTELSRNPYKLLAALSNKELKSLGIDVSSFATLQGDERAKAIDAASRQQKAIGAAKSLVEDTLIIRRDAIETAVGGSLAENVLSRLQSRSESELLNRPSTAGSESTAVTGSATNGGSNEAARPTRSTIQSSEALKQVSSVKAVQEAPAIGGKAAESSIKGGSVAENRSGQKELEPHEQRARLSGQHAEVHGRSVGPRPVENRTIRSGGEGGYSPLVVIGVTAAGLLWGSKVVMDQTEDH